MSRLIYVILPLCALLCAPFAAVAEGTPNAGAGTENGPTLIIILDDDEEDDGGGTVQSDNAPRRPVSFSLPLLGGNPWVAGQSIETLINGTPVFPPIEGLPDEVWKEKQCSDCHGWDRETICEQAEFYLPEDRIERLNKPHPYGGSFKSNLRIWAQDGCP